MSADLISHVVAGHHMRLFLAGDRKAAVSSIVSSCFGWTDTGRWGQVTAKGIGLHAGVGGELIEFVTWAEVTAAIQRGARPELVEAFRAADALWQAHLRAPDRPFRPDMTDTERAAAEAHSAAYGRATRALRDATAAIIAAGYADAPVQGDLFEVGA